MSGEESKAQEHITAVLQAHTSLSEHVDVQDSFTLVCVDADGQFIWHEETSVQHDETDAQKTRR